MTSRVYRYKFVITSHKVALHIPGHLPAFSAQVPPIFDLCLPHSVLADDRASHITENIGEIREDSPPS